MSSGPHGFIFSPQVDKEATALLSHQAIPVQVPLGRGAGEEERLAVTQVDRPDEASGTAQVLVVGVVFSRESSL